MIMTLSSDWQFYARISQYVSRKNYFNRIAHFQSVQMTEKVWTRAARSLIKGRCQSHVRGHAVPDVVMLLTGQYRESSCPV